MAAIGHVTKLATGGYQGQIKTLSIRADIDLVPNSSYDLVATAVRGGHSDWGTFALDHGYPT